MPDPDAAKFEAVRQAIGRGHDVTIAVRGRSMMPSLVPDADNVVLSPVRGTLRCGDIVLAQITGARYVLHRIIAVGPDGTLTLMGDGNLHQRERCRQGDVVGVVTLVRGIGGSGRRPGRARLWRMLRPLRPLIVKLFPSMR